MHGAENYNRFANGHGVDECTIGESVSLIHEVRFLSLVGDLYLHAFQAIRDGKMQQAMIASLT